MPISGDVRLFASMGSGGTHIKRLLQFILFYVLMFLAFHYLPKRGRTVPTIPAAVMALPAAAFLAWKLHKQES
jgi:cytosine/uracil/thiamine/allantoin permease